MAGAWTGALELLRSVETLDWPALYSGEVCMDELQRVRRVARQHIISLPSFLVDVDHYRHQLRQIAAVNGVMAAPPPPAAAGSSGPVNTRLAVRGQRITAKLSVAPAVRPLATAAAIPPPLRRAEKTAGDTDKLRLTGTPVELSTFRLTSNAARRLVTLHQQYERSARVNSVSRPLTRVNIPVNSHRALKQR